MPHQKPLRPKPQKPKVRNIPEAARQPTEWEIERNTAKVEHPFDFIPNADYTFQIVYYGDWSDYEESGYMFVLEKDGQYYIQQGGYSVMAEDNTPYWDPWPCTEEQALKEMLDWELVMEDNERNMS